MVCPKLSVDCNQSLKRALSLLFQECLVERKLSHIIFLHGEVHIDGGTEAYHYKYRKNLILRLPVFLSALLRGGVSRGAKPLDN